ncbi:hypothetical protein B0J17DRAFT_718441 [Rhizoctonia solani]|nr:hypothetical protein B0J17DRAFT_718441 [Rhizoctonia solani]
MLEELRNASSRLQVALDHYVRTCSSIQDTCLKGTIPKNNIPDYIEQVEREIGLVEIYNTTMQVAKTAIRTIHNYAFRIAPINRLPVELLTRIFHVARNTDAYSVDCVALVCSRWRATVLQDSSLWTRVDIRPSFRESYPSLSRAEAHALRSDEMPLEVHVWGAPDAQWSHKEEFVDTPMENPCRLIAPRMRYLEVDGDFDSDRWPSSTYSALDVLLSCCSLGVLTEIVTSSKSDGFFTSCDWDEDEEANLGTQAITRLEMVTSEELEAALARVSMLKLTRLFIPWTSQAYRGLTELRLTGHSASNLSISEQQIINIIKSSPGLRVLQLCLRISDQVNESNITVSLPELESLQFDAEESWENMRYNVWLPVVRFLEAGPRPLRFSMHCYGKNSQNLLKQISRPSLRDQT